jgi:hypothetical protein
VLLILRIIQVDRFSSTLTPQIFDPADIWIFIYSDPADTDPADICADIWIFIYSDPADTDTTVSASKLAWLEARLVELKALEKEVNEHPDKQVSQTDSDAHLMKTHHMERQQLCYNVQSAVETKHHLIVEHDVTMTVDRG